MRDLTTSKLQSLVRIKLKQRAEWDIRSVEHGSKNSSGATSDEIVKHLSLLGLLLGEKLLDLVNNTKVAGVPGDVSPHGALKTVVHGQNSLLGDNLADNVHHSRVLAGRRLVLKSDFDELEGNDDERLGGSGGGSGQNGQSLGLLSHTESLAVVLAPRVVGSKLCSSGLWIRFLSIELVNNAYLLGASIRMGAEIPR